MEGFHLFLSDEFSAASKSKLIAESSSPTMDLRLASLVLCLAFISTIVNGLAFNTTMVAAPFTAAVNGSHRQLDVVSQVCTPPIRAPSRWHYNDFSSTQTGCIGTAPKAFSMISAYVYGGKENVDWKYTSNPNDPDCLRGWTYYEKDKTTVREYVAGSLSLNPKKSKKTWCPLNVYRLGGLQGKQWDYCSCAVFIPISAYRPTADGCSIPARSVRNWRYDEDEGPYNCTLKHEKSGKKWTMLNAYRSGGDEGVHWKYTDDPYDLECLVDWTYYESDGKTKIADIDGSLTTLREGKSWCALPVYRPDGQLGYQWDFCICP